MTTRCDCCDLPVESCGLAVERAVRAAEASERARLALPGWFAAEFEGKCARCGHWFMPGTPIIMSHGWICCG